MVNYPCGIVYKKIDTLDHVGEKLQAQTLTPNRAIATIFKYGAHVFLNQLKDAIINTCAIDVVVKHMVHINVNTNRSKTVHPML